MSEIKKFAVMGNPVSHSLSPQIHQMFAEQFDISLQYTAIQVEPGGFETAVKQFLADGGKGLNITVPFKLEAWQLADRRSPRAELAGAVNTLKLEQDGSLFADNTDGVGMIRDIADNLGKSVAGAKVLMIGAGGAVRGVLGPLLQAQPESLHVANRTVAKAHELVSVFADYGNCTASGLDEIGEQAYDIVINGTAASLHGSVPDLPATIFANASLAYDMMYSQDLTPFLAWAKSNGAAQLSDGLGMLVEQAAESFYLWHAEKPATGPVIQALR